MAEQIFQDPLKAREYIKYFEVLFGREIKHVGFPSGTIYTDTMTDEEAVKVANALHEMEKETTHGARPQ